MTKHLNTNIYILNIVKTFFATKYGNFNLNNNNVIVRRGNDFLNI